MTEILSSAKAGNKKPVTYALLAGTALALISMSGVRAADSIDAGALYEPLPTFKASDLLPPEIMRGELHTVLETVENDGYENNFTITSQFGTITAHRTDFVAERVQEVYALDKLSEITRSDAFAKGVAQAATSPFRALKGLATEPVGTVTGAVKGIGALFSQLGGMASGSRGELEDSAAKELVGFGEIKREVAGLLEVDPYTTNQAIQEGIGEVSWAGFAGGLSLAPLTAQVGGGVGAALSGVQNARTLNSLLTSQSPEALRGINRIRLEEIGVDDALIEKFVESPWLSPRHETTITAALIQMDGTENHGAILERATVSESEDQSIFLMRQAEASLGFHQNVAAIARFERVDQIVLLYTADNRAVSVLPADHLVWSEGAESLADQNVSAGALRELWLTGSISDLARSEFKKRGWAVVAGQSDKLAPDLDAGLAGEEVSEDEGSEEGSAEDE